MTRDEVSSICGLCGASIYKQHLDSGIARYEGGKLLCAHCVAEYERSHDAAAGAAADVFEPIEFEDVDDDQAVEADMSQSRIHGMAEATLGKAAGRDEARFKRPLQPDSPGAIRCRTFHSKITEGAIEFMNNQINEWLESNDQIVIKFANSTIGPFEGKHTEPNLILTLFY